MPQVETFNQHYDKCCLNNQCIANKRAFYSHIDSHKQHQGHSTFSIITENILSILKVSHNKITQSKNQSSIQEQIRNNLNQLFLQLSAQIYTTFLSKKILQFKEQASIFNSLTVKGIWGKLLKGDYLYLKMIKYFSENQNSQSVEKKMEKILRQRQATIRERFNNIEANVKDIVKQLQIKLQQSQPSTQYVQLEKIMQKIFPKQRVLIQEQQPKYIQKQNFHEDMLVKIEMDQNIYFNRTICRKSESIKMQEQFNKKPSLDQTIYNPEGDKSQDQEEQKQKKYKLIKKDEKKSYSRKDQSKAKKQNSLQIHQGMTSVQWKQKLKCITDKQQLKSIHIFDQKFTIQKFILYSMSIFPNVKLISFNCHSKLHEQQTLSMDLLKRLENVSIEFKWKMSRYIQKYYKYIYFNQQDLYKTQAVVYKKNDNLQKLLLNNIKPTSFWIYEQNILKQALEKCKLQYLTTLNIIGNSFRIKKFQHLRSIKLLRNLILKGVQFDKKLQYNNHLVEFIRQNKNISTFILQQTNIPQSTLNEIICALQQLPNLKRLSLNFFDLTNANFLQIIKNNELQFLHLRNIKFSYVKESQYQIIRLSSKLRFLCLYQCSSLQLNLIARLLKESSKTLTHLYIGNCSSIQTSWLTMIQPLVNLVGFGLDSINVSGTQLVSCFKKMRANSRLKIQYLAIDKDEGGSYSTLNDQLMDQLSEIMPDLQVLSIFHQRDLKRYDFSKFRALRVILTDQRLMSKLEKKICDRVRIITDRRNKRYRSQ